MTRSAPPPRIAGLSHVRPLGEGGFATVELYEQNLPRRLVAVKSLKAPVGSERERRDFQVEADAMALLSNHPAIVSMYGAGVAADGRPYLLMEYCPGSMRDQTRGRPAHLAQVLDVGVRLAGALETAHRAGILHRDIKPSNVLITTMGRPVLADFGIAALSGRESSEQTASAVSIPWSAPEVLLGRTRGSIAGEVWSLAATLYTFAAGRSPFEDPDPERNTRDRMTARITRAAYTPIPGAQGYELFDAVLKKAMMPDPAQRFPSMDRFAGALQELQRRYGFDVTPFDMDRTDWSAEVLRPVDDAEDRGVGVTAIRARTRAQARAAAIASRVDADGVTADRPPSARRAALLGAGAALFGVGLLAIAARMLGWG